MIKTTFAAYKARFKELMVIMKPLIVIQLLVLILTIIGQNFEENGNYIPLIVGGILLIVLSILQWLIYTPAAYRTIQKRELGESITVDQAIAFQKGNKWNYFMLMIWTFLYTLYYSLFTILPIGIGIAIMALLSPLGMAGMVVGGICMAIATGFGLYYALINLAKLFFIMNVYFAKNLEPRENVRESIALGKTHRTDIYRFVGGILVINIIGAILSVIPLFFDMSQVLNNQEPTFLFTTIASIWSFIIGVLFLFPMTYLYLSKAYAKIRAVTEPLAQNIPLNPESTVVTPEIVQ